MTMKLTLNRHIKNPETDACFGELLLDGTKECVTLERLSVLIPPGEYALEYYTHHADKPTAYRCLILKDVPGREYIEIHIANYPTELRGCIAPGTTHNQDSVSNSGFAFAALMKKIGLPATISVTDAL